MTRRKQPITIHGITYPTRRAAAEALGMSVSGINAAVFFNRLDRIGAKRPPPPPPMPVPVRIRGRDYPSIKAAAAALKVSPSTVSTALSRGTIDGVGTGTGRGRVKEWRGGTPPKPIQIGKITFKSVRGAARDLGTTTATLRRKIACGDAQWLAAKISDMLARREREAIAARAKAHEQAIIAAESAIKGRQLTSLRGRVTASELEAEARAIAMRAARAPAQHGRK